MPPKEALFWLGSIVFGTGIWFTVQPGSEAVPVIAVVYMIVGVAAMAYSLVLHHWPDSWFARRPPAWAIGLLLLALGAYGFMARPGDSRLPGLSVNAFMRLHHLPANRRRYLYDFGSPTAERFSVYVTADNVFTVLFVDAKGEPHPVQAMVGTDVPLEQFMYLACEAGVAPNATLITLSIDAKQIAGAKLPFRADIGALDVPNGRIGADLSGENGAKFDLIEDEIFTATLTQHDREKILASYGELVRSGPAMSFDGEHSMRVGRMPTAR